MTGRKKKSNFRKIWYSPPIKLMWNMQGICSHVTHDFGEEILTTRGRAVCTFFWRLCHASHDHVHATRDGTGYSCQSKDFKKWDELGMEFW